MHMKSGPALRFSFLSPPCLLRALDRQAQCTLPLFSFPYRKRKNVNSTRSHRGRTRQRSHQILRQRYHWLVMSLASWKGKDAVVRLARALTLSSQDGKDAGLLLVPVFT